MFRGYRFGRDAINDPLVFKKMQPPKWIFIGLVLTGFFSIISVFVAVVASLV